jgi:hypothetical protein
MNSYSKLALSAALAISLLMPSVVSAEEASTHRLGSAWQSALAGSEPVLTPQQFAKLNNLAYQSAATRVCDGFEIDQAKFTTALADATAPGKSGLSDDETRLHQTFVLIEFGARYGLFLAEGNAQKQSFCASAVELKGKADIPLVWE